MRPQLLDKQLSDRNSDLKVAILSYKCEDLVNFRE